MKETISHRLTFMVRFKNHFFGEAVPDTLPVRLSTSSIRPIPSKSGSIRQKDGTYRFVDVEPGIHEVLWLPSFSNSYRGWTSWDKPFEVTLPLENSMRAEERDLWPTPDATVPAGVTAIRGRLCGDNLVNQKVQIRPSTSAPASHWTRTNRYGEFLFLFARRIEPNDDGLIELTAEVTGRTINEPTDGAPFFMDSNFKIRPGVETRIKFQVT